MKKLLLYVAILLLTACTKQSDTTIDIKEPITETINEENDETEPVRYTGEIISDGYFGEKGRIYFVPDKETRELLKNGV